MRKLIVLLALTLTFALHVHAQGFQPADLFINVNTTCASTMTFTLAGNPGITNNTAFILNLNCNVTSSSIAGFPQVGNRIQFSITNAGSFTFAWPSNFLNPPTVKTTGESDISFWYDGTNWHTSQTVTTAASTGNNGDLQANGGSGTFIASHINDNGTNLSLTENLTTAGSENVWLKPPTPLPASTAGFQYVAAYGNDSNDGLSWGTAKATVVAALEALPNGTVSPPQIGSGTVFIGDNVWWNPDHSKGLWVLDTNDPNYNSPPAGWIKGVPPTFWPLSIIGQGCGTLPAGNTNIAACVVKMNDFPGIGNGGTNNPAIWLAGPLPTHLENINVSGNYGRCMALGIDSTGNRSNTATAAVNKSFQNMFCGGVDGVDNTGKGRGPSIDIGPAFFDTFDKVFATTETATNQSLIAASPTGLSVTNGVLTVTFTAANTAYFTGEGCGILGANSSAYNFSVQGTPGGVGITVVDSTHITMPTALANGTSGGGFFVCDRGIPVVLDAGTTGAGGEIIYRDATLNGGGIKQRGGQLTVRDVTTEGNFTNCTSPVIWFIATGGGLGQGVVADYIAESDQCPTVNNFAIATPVKVEGGISPENIQIISPQEFPYTEGPLTYHGDNNYQVNQTPLSRNEWGVVRGHLAGQTDVARHSPQSVRYPNKEHPTPATWSSLGVVFTTGQLDNDGGTNAVNVTVPSGSGSLSFSSSDTAITFPGSWNNGDAGICGVWMRSLGTADPFQGAPPLSISCGPTGSGQAVSSQCNIPIVHGQGEWEWYFCYFSVGAGPSNNLSTFTLNSLTPSTPIRVYAPTFVYIPAADGVSNNDLTELAYSLSSVQTIYPSQSGCVTGTVCDYLGPIPHMSVANSWTAVQTFPGAATSQFFDVQQVTNAPANPPVAGCRLFTLSGVLQGVSSTGTSCLPSGGGGGGGNVSSSGTPTNGQLAQWVNSTNIQGVTLLPASAMPALTQDVNNTVGSFVTTVNGLKGNPVPTLAPGFLNWNGSVFSWSTPATNVGGGATIGDLTQYNSPTTVNDSGIIAANVVTNTTNLVNANLIQGTGNHTIADSTIAIANVTQNSTAGTANALPKWAGPHTLTNSSVSDNGTFVTNTESVDLQANALVSEYANAGSTGTTLNKLAKFTGAPSAVVLAATTDTNGIIGICVGNCTTTGTAQIAISGQVSCVFSNATTAGHYVQISSATAGDCQDSNSATPPATGQIIGRVLSTNGAAGTYVIDLYAADLSAGGGGGGSGTINNASQFSIPFYSAAGSSNVISGVAAPTSPNNVPYFWVSTASAGNATAPQLLLGGVPVNSNLGTTPYNMATTDRLSELQGNPSTPFVINLPNGNTSGFSNNFASVFRNYGTAVFSLVAPSGINLNTVSAGTLSLLPNWTAWMWQDSSNNLWLSRFPTADAFGATCANGVTWNTSTGLGCLSAAPVLSGGTAGGDLSGTYPNPTVAQVNGGAVPVSALAVGTNSSSQLIASALQGTDTKLMTAGVVVTSAGSGVCLDANGGITTSSCAGTVNTITGDGALITNSASTGAVTLTLGTAAAHKVWMNNTGSTATPGYQSIGTADLPTGIPNANLANASTTPNGQTCTLGSACNVNNGATTHSVALNEGAGAAIAGVACGAGTTIQGAASADPTCTASPTLGVQNTTASALTLAGAAVAGAAGSLTINNTGTTPATTTIGTAATTSNTILGFSAAPTSKSIVTCVTSSTTCTLTGLDFPEHIVVPAANCNAGTAGAGWSLPSTNAPTVTCRAGTNNLGGVLQWANNNTTMNAQFTFQLPFDWDTATQPYWNIVYASGANTSGTVKWTISSACTKSDGSVTDDPAFVAETTSTGKTLTTANRMWSENAQFANITSGNNCVAGSTVILKVTSGNGTATSVVNVEQLTLTVPRLITVQAN